MANRQFSVPQVSWGKKEDGHIFVQATFPDNLTEAQERGFESATLFEEGIVWRPLGDMVQIAMIAATDEESDRKALAGILEHFTGSRFETVETEPRCFLKLPPQSVAA